MPMTEQSFSRRGSDALQPPRPTCQRALQVSLRAWRPCRSPRQPDTDSLQEGARIVPRCRPLRLAHAGANRLVAARARHRGGQCTTSRQVRPKLRPWHSSCHLPGSIREHSQDGATTGRREGERGEVEDLLRSERPLIKYGSAAATAHPVSLADGEGTPERRDLREQCCLRHSPPPRGRRTAPRQWRTPPRQ